MIITRARKAFQYHSLKTKHTHSHAQAYHKHADKNCMVTIKLQGFGNTCETHPECLITTHATRLRANKWNRAKLASISSSLFNRLHLTQETESSQVSNNTCA